MESLRQFDQLYVYTDGVVEIGRFSQDLLPPEVFYKQLSKVKANGEKTFKPLDKAPPKQFCPLHNCLALNEHFRKVMQKCVLPEDFGLEEFSEDFIGNIGISMGTQIDNSKLWCSVTSSFQNFLTKYTSVSFSK